MPRGLNPYDEARLQGRLWPLETIMSSILLWFDASDLSTLTFSGSDVSGWNDKSTFRSNVSQATGLLRPSYAFNYANGRGAVIFNGDVVNGKWLAGGRCSQIEGQSAISIFAIVNANFNSSSQFCIWSYASAPNYAADILHGGYSSNQVLQINNGTDSGFVDTSGTVGSLFINEYIYNGSLSGNTNRLKKFDNAVEKTLTYDSPGPPATTSTNASNALQIGTYLGAPTFTMNGGICEILVVRGPTSSQLQNVIQGYLAYKWGLESRLPAAHPFRNRPPLIGD